MKVYLDIQQGTPKWAALRAGIPTASMFSNIITPGGKKSESQDKYMNHLLAERVIGKPIDGFQSKYMAMGNESEDKAVDSYQFVNNCETYRVGFVTIDDGRIGCSPDRFIVDQETGMLEAKAPTPAVHVSYLLASIGASKEYKVQLQAELWVCEREWVDIISYCAGFPDATFRVTRDEVFIKEMAAHVRAFSGRLEEKTEEFRAKGWIKEPSEVQEPDGIPGLGITDEDIADLTASYGWAEKEMAL